MTEPHPPAPLRPVSDEHRHEPADYELEPNELVGCPNPWCSTHRDTDPEIAAANKPVAYEPVAGRWLVCCPVCPIKGPTCDTEAEAIAAWNQRAPLATRPADVREALELVSAAMLRDANGVELGFGWDITALNRARPSIRNALTALTQAPRSCCDAEAFDEAAKIAEEAGEMVERFWLSLREPGCVPERKGPWPLRETAKILREFIAARPTAYIDYITLDCFGAPHIQHGPEVLQMADGRSMGAGRKHNARVRDAVPNFWQRFNDWTSDRTPGKPFEICRYGRDDEDEIVVVHACASQGEADEKQLDAILAALGDDVG